MSILVTDNELEELEEKSEELREWMEEHFHPHVKAIVTSTGIELMEGIASYQEPKEIE